MKCGVLLLAHSSFHLRRPSSGLNGVAPSLQHGSAPLNDVFSKIIYHLCRCACNHSRAMINKITWLLKTVSAWSRHCAAENCCLSLNNLGEKRCFFLSFQQGVFLWITIIVVARCFVLSRTVGESVEWVTENFYWNALVTEGKENLAALFSPSATSFYEHWSGRCLKWAFIRSVRTNFSWCCPVFISLTLQLW